LDLRGYIAGWNGVEATTILFTSATQTMNAAGTLQQFTFNPNLSLIPGNEYVAFLSISELPGGGNGVFSMPLAGDLIPGGLAFLNNGFDPSQWTTTPWGQDPVDVWFQASYRPPSPAPSPRHDLGERRPAHLVATAEEDRLSIRHDYTFACDKARPARHLAGQFISCQSRLFGPKYSPCFFAACRLPNLRFTRLGVGGRCSEQATPISAQCLMFDIVVLPARATCAPNPTFVIRVGLLLHVNCVSNFHTCDFHKMTKIAFAIIDAVETGNCLSTRLLYGGPRTDCI
jgi:hypothetical protein